MNRSVETPHGGRLEHHDPPDWIVREVKKIGGMENGQPRFRVIWGADRIRFTDEGVIYRPYQVNRWHVEKLYKGEYEHSYTLAHCTHMKNFRWCNDCFKSGGEFLPLTLAVVEMVIRLVLKAERLQSAALQKAALVEREEKKKKAADAEIKGVFAEAFPREVKRSFDPAMERTAEQAFGRGKLKQISRRNDGTN